MLAETGRDLLLYVVVAVDKRGCSPEPSARPSAAASEERQICTTCLFAESWIVYCFLPSLYKDNAFQTW